MRRTTTVCVLVGLGMSASLHAEETADSPMALPALAASTEQVSVVGVSSGGYMASQLAVAWPERFSGLGVLAAGPWGCSQGSLSLALNQCMMTRRGLPDLDQLEQRRQDYAERGEVGSREALSQLKVFIWHGENDPVFDPRLSDALAEQFSTWLDASGEQLKVVRDEQAGHGWPVRLPEEEAVSPEMLGDCQEGGGSHVLSCGKDIAGDMMEWLHPRKEAQDPQQDGELLRFDQTEFDAKGLADVGYLFIPPGCADGDCGVTLALHGCQMSHEQIGETFVRHSGLNRWALEHEQVVLYPQATTTLGNPQGCWDWWGFAESTWQISPLHETRSGTQIEALMAMLSRLQEPSEALSQ
ncbi:PHB depolymerase family esterase [Halomonas sediminis]